VVLLAALAPQRDAAARRAKNEANAFTRVEHGDEIEGPRSGGDLRVPWPDWAMYVTAALAKP